MSTRVRSGYGSEVRQQDKKLMNLQPSILHNFAHSPAKFLPKAKGLRALATARKMK